MDPTGNAVAVWDEGEALEFDAPEDIRSNGYAPGVGWGAADGPIDILTGPAVFARVAIDDDGNAVVVWQQEAANRLDIWANHYVPDTGWAALGERLGTEEGNARRPQVAMDADGNAVAVWYQSDGMRNDIWSNHYTPDEGWGMAERIERNDGEARWPQIAMDAGGDAVAVWQQCDVGDCDCFGEDCEYSRWNVWSNRYTSGRWGTHQPIASDEGDATRPDVAVDATGNAVAVWQQFDGTHDNIWSNRKAADRANWEEAEPIESLDEGDASRPQVAMDPEGNAVAVWSQFDGMNDDIWSNRYTPSGGWDLAERIEGNDPGEARRPKVAMDPGGTAVAVWTQPDGVHVSIWSNRYTPSFGWGTAEPIETWDGGRAREPEVAMDTNGEAVAVWSQRTGGADRIWSNRLRWRDADTGGPGGSDGEGSAAQAATE
jgi:hypothetical protein